MAGINKVIIVGRLGTDPEVKTLAGGQTVTRISVATSEQWSDKDGKKQEKTEWHRITTWGKLAEICGKHLSKGRQVYVEGRLQTNSWEDQQGQKRYSTEIVANTVQFLGAQSDREQSSSYSPSSSSSSSGNQHPADQFQDFGPEPAFDSKEDLPF